MMEAIEGPGIPTADSFDPIVKKLSQPEMYPDVVVTCVYNADCAEWVQSIGRVNWSPKAQVFNVFIGMETFEEAAGTYAE